MIFKPKMSKKQKDKQITNVLGKYGKGRETMKSDIKSFIELLKEFINTKDVSESVKEQFIYFGLVTKHYAYANLTKEDLVVLLKNFNELKQLVPSKPLMEKLDKMEAEFKGLAYNTPPPP